MNMMKYCPECYKELPPNSASCPFCGYKTGNGSAEELTAPKILKTPQTDSYIPPEQTVLSLLLLLIFFWGMNLAITTLPIFLNAGTVKNIIIAAIISQVITRALIGSLAVQEQALKKDSNPSKKAGAFLLSFVPIGGIYSFLHASRTIIRKDYLSNLTISSIFAVILMSVMLFASKDGINYILTGEKPAEEAAVIADPTLAAIVIEDTAIPPTATLRAYEGGCRNPKSITADEEGDQIIVCGEVTNFGDIECESCPQNFYSYIKLDNEFQIVSYDYHFSFAFLHDCIMVTDKVEILGEDPVFTYGKGEECAQDAEGELICSPGTYFKESATCK